MNPVRDLRVPDVRRENISLSIVIVNWNAGRQLADCIASIFAASGSVDLQDVIVVDNGSVDGSTDELGSHNLPVRVIRNTTNRGFARACNQGAKLSLADYLLFLNPDSRLFNESLTRPLRFMEIPENRRVAIVGVQLVDADGHVSCTCARFPTAARFFSTMLGLDRAFPKRFPSHFMKEWDHRDSREVDQVMGAFFLIRRTVFEELGRFDERFFVYFEEVDLAVRARQRGWRTYYLSEAKVYHKGGGTTERVKPTRLFYSLRSRVLYSYKHFGWWSATTVLLGTMLVEPVTRVVVATFRRSGSDLGATLRAYAMMLGDMPMILSRAWRSSRP